LLSGLQGNCIEVLTPLLFLRFCKENDPLSFTILSTNNPFILNPNTSYMLCKIDPVTGDVTA